MSNPAFTNCSPIKFKIFVVNALAPKRAKLIHFYIKSQLHFSLLQSITPFCYTYHCFPIHNMARGTGRAKSTSKTPITTSSTTATPSDNPDPAQAATVSSALSQEVSTQVQATTPNTTKKSKPRSSAPKAVKIRIPVVKPVTTAPLNPNDAAALLARLAEQQGKHFLSRKR
jgi:hypothetical protein